MAKFTALVSVPNTKIAKGKNVSVAVNVAIYFRYLVEQQQGAKALAIDNQQINAIADQIGDDFDTEQERQDEVVRLLMVADGQIEEDAAEQESVEEDAAAEDAETNGKDENEDTSDLPIEAANDVAKEAAKFIAKAANDAEFNAEIKFAADSDRRIKVMPLVMYMRLQTLYGKELDTAPMPNTNAKTSGNYKPDKRATQVPKAGGEGFTTRIVSMLDSMADMLPESIKATAILDQTKDKDSRKGTKYEHTGNYDLAQLRKDSRAIIVLSRNLFRKAVGIHHMLSQCENIPNVEVSYLRDPQNKNKPKSTQFPFVISDTTDKQNNEFMSVTQFLALDPSQCKDPAALKKNQGSMWRTLKTSGSRGAGEARVPKGFCPRILIMDQAEAAFSQIAHWAEVDKTDSAMFNRLQNGKPADSNDLLESLDIVYTFLTPFMQDPDIQKRVGDLKVARLQREKSERKIA